MTSSTSLTDFGGLPVTTSSSVAFAEYEQALDRFLAGRTTAEEHARRAVAEDEGFAMGWLVLALQRRLVGRLDESDEYFERALPHADRVSDREASTLRFFGHLFRQERGAAELAGIDHLRRYPRDHIVVMYVHFLYNILLPVTDRRDRHLALARELAPSWGDDWFLLGELAFVETEAGNHGLARDLAERALTQRPESGWATHAMAHAMLETGAVDEGERWLGGWLAEWGAGAGSACHLTWHHALLHLAAADGVAVAQRLDAITDHVGRSMSVLADGASLMWRLHLDEPQAELPWEALAEVPSPAGFAFGNLHRGFVLAGLGRLDDLRAYAQQIDPLVGEVCQALADLESGNARSAAECLLDREDELVLIGGSRAQLEVLEDTLIAALHRSGGGGEAADRLNRRLARRASSRDQRWLATIG